MNLPCFLGLLLSDLLRRELEDITPRNIGLSPQKYSVLQQLIIQVSFQTCRELKSETRIKWQPSNFACRIVA